MFNLRNKAGNISRKYLGVEKTHALKSLLPKSSESSSDEVDYGDNTVVNHPKLENARISFKGTGNILYCESPYITLKDCKISFEGDNSIFYISKHSNKKRKYRINMYIHHNSAVYIGKNVNFHPGGAAYIVASENKHIVIGDDCLFSLGSLFRTSDGHAAYDSSTKQRINNAKSIFIGDHIWIGQNVTLLKGTKIGSGSIIGAGSVATGKALPSNSSCAGTPARALRGGIFFNKPNVNGYTEDQLDISQKHDSNDWIYKHDKNTMSFDDIDAGLSSAKTSDQKLLFIQKHLANNRHKNRFFIGDD